MNKPFTIQCCWFQQNIRELNILDFWKTIGYLTNVSKEFLSKNHNAEEKDESPFQTRHNCNWIKFSCYSSDKGFRKIGDVNI